MLDFSLVEHLTTAATLANGNVSTGELTADTPMPAVVIERVNGRRNRVLSGRALFADASFNIHAVGNTVESARLLNQQVHDILDGFRGLLGTASPTDVKSCFSDAEAASRVVRDGDLFRAIFTEPFRLKYVDG